MRVYLLLLVIASLLLAGCHYSKPGRKAIAILVPVSHPSLEQIVKGISETIEEAEPERYHFDVFNAQGSKILMRSEVEEMAQNNYDLVFAVGASSARMVKEVFKKKNNNTPIVFTCVNNPLELHLIESEENPGGNMTGVTELLDFDQELASLLTIKPEVKKIILVYNPSEPGLQKDRMKVESILDRHGIHLTPIEVFQANEIKSKVTPFMSEADALIVLKDNTVVTALDGLIKLCESYRIPLVASDLDSPDRGAALGFGVYEREFGVQAASKAMLILDQGIQPGNIPVTPVDRFFLNINSEACLKQGIKAENIEKAKELPYVIGHS